jgi:ribosome-binding ATPase YchF (GTP1/OBG family)
MMTTGVGEIAGLGLITFFTTRSRECHAWTLDEVANAQQAAGRIHSDMARGFIRTDVINWRDLIEAGTDAEARKRALLRTEGKDYVVQDGDVLHILFNV